MPRIALSREDSTLLKGVGILLIILHNFFHAFPGMDVECEFAFEPDKVNRFFPFMRGGNWREILLALFSFFGHYGVAIFVFISGYGLSKRYAHSPESGWQIAKHRTIQLWKWLVPILLLYLLDLYSGHTHFAYKYVGNNLIVGDVIRILTFTSNFIGEKFIIAGPWWYFGMAFQLYILYACCLRKASDRQLWLLTGSAWLLLLLLSIPKQEGIIYATVYNLHCNSIGWLPVFCLGILAERHPFSLSWRWVIGGIMVCIPCFFLPYLWVFSSVSVLFFFMAILPLCRKRWIRDGILFVGGISAAVFVTHSFVRQKLLDYIPDVSPEALGAIFLTISLLCGWIYAKGLAFIYRKFHW